MLGIGLGIDWANKRIIIASGSNNIISENGIQLITEAGIDIITEQT